MSEYLTDEEMKSNLAEGETFLTDEEMMANAVDDNENTDRPWYSVSSEGLETALRGTLAAAPLSTVSQAALSGAKALYRGATEDTTIPQAYQEEMARYEAERARLNEQLGTAGTIIAGAPYLAAGIGTALTDVGSRTALTQGTEEVLPEVSKAGLAMTALTALPKGAGALIKGASKIPAYFRGASSEAIEHYQARPTEVMEAATQYEPVVTDVAEFGTKLRQRVTDAESALNQAEDRFGLAQGKSQAEIAAAADQLRFARQNLKDSQAALKEQDLALRQESLKARDVVGEASKGADEAFAKAEAERQAKIESLNEQLKNPDPALVGKLQQQLLDLKDETGRLAKAQIDQIKEDGQNTEVDAGIIFDAARSIRDDLTIRGQETSKSAPITALLNKWDRPEITDTPLDAWEAVKLRQDIDNMIDYDKRTGEYGGMAEATLSAVRTKINQVLDSNLSNYPDLRKQLADMSNLQSASSELFGGRNIESAISRIGGKNTGRIEDVIRRMDEVEAARKTGVSGSLPGRSFEGPSVRDLLAERLDLQNQLKTIKATPTTRGTPELAAAEQRLKEVERQIVETGLAQKKISLEQTPVIAEKAEQRRLLQEELKKLKESQDLQRSVFKGEVSSAENEARRLGFTSEKEVAPYTVAESAIRRGGAFEPESIAAQRELELLGEAMGRPELPTTAKDIGAYQQLFSKSRPSTGTSGASWVSRAAALTPEWAVKLPLDMQRNVSKTLNTKWATSLKEAFNRGGARAVSATHYLLQQSDPEYQKATLEDGEGTE